MPVLVIDGSRFSDFEGFAREVSALLTDYTWRGNLDAFDDILSGGFGTPDGGFTLRWTHSNRSRIALGYPATVPWLKEMLAKCHPSNRERVQARLDAARRGQGPTLFDHIVDIIQSHGPGGRRPGGVELELA